MQLSTTSFQNLRIVDLSDVERFSNPLITSKGGVETTTPSYSKIEQKEYNSTSSLEEEVYSAVMGGRPLATNLASVHWQSIKNPIKKEKQDYINTLRTLRGRHQLLRNEIEAILMRQLIRDEVGNFFKNTIEQEENDILKERKAAEIQFRNIKSNVYKLDAHLKKPKDGHNYYEQLKTFVQSIETDILLFKEKQRNKYGDLLKKEKKLKQDLVHTDQRIQHWESIFNPALIKRPLKEKPTSDRHVASSSSNSSIGQVLPEVSRFQEFVWKNGGHTGGWDEYMHSDYIKMRTKLGEDNPKLVDISVESLPGINHSDVLSHEAWYRTYLRLLDEKKAAIFRWKEERENERKRTEILLRNSHVVKEHKKLDEQKEKALQDVKENELKRWKEKMAETRKIMTEEKKKQQLEIEQQERLRQEGRLRLKKKVEIYQKQKEKELELNRLLKEASKFQEREELKSNIEKLKMFQEKDRELQLRRKKQLASRRKSLESAKSLDLGNKNEKGNLAKRDPSRVLKPTENFINKLKASKVKLSEPFRVVTPQRLSVPQWRAGL